MHHFGAELAKGITKLRERTRDVPKVIFDSLGLFASALSAFDPLTGLNRELLQEDRTFDDACKDEQGDVIPMLVSNSVRDLHGLFIRWEVYKAPQVFGEWGAFFYSVFRTRVSWWPTKPPKNRWARHAFMVYRTTATEHDEVFHDPEKFYNQLPQWWKRKLKRRRRHRQDIHRWWKTLESQGNTHGQIAKLHNAKYPNDPRSKAAVTKALKRLNKPLE